MEPLAYMEPLIGSVRCYCNCLCCCAFWCAAAKGEAARTATAEVIRKDASRRGIKLPAQNNLSSLARRTSQRLVLHLQLADWQALLRKRVDTTR